MTRFIYFILSLMAAFTVFAGCGQCTGSLIVTSPPGYNYSNYQIYTTMVTSGNSGPPAGFNLVYSQVLIRNGASVEDNATAILNTLNAYYAEANQSGELNTSSTGGGIADILYTNLLNTYAQYTSQYGDGNLTNEGLTELYTLGQNFMNFLQSDSTFTTNVTDNNLSIEVWSTTMSHALDSESNFTQGMIDTNTTAMTYTVNEANASERNCWLQPYRYKATSTKNGYCNAEFSGRADYVSYMAKLPPLIDTIGHYNKNIGSAGVALLNSVFDTSFIVKNFMKSDGNISFEYSNLLYKAASAIPALTNEQNDTSFVSNAASVVTNEQSQYLGQNHDYGIFYGYGPAFPQDQNLTTTLTSSEINATRMMGYVTAYKFFYYLQALVEGNISYAASVNIAGTESVVSTATYLQIPPYDVPDQNFSYADNNFTGIWFAKFANNLRWDVYTDGSGTYLIKPLINEQDATFKSDCTPYTGTTNYYEYTELISCYGWDMNNTPAPSGFPVLTP